MERDGLSQFVAGAAIRVFDLYRQQNPMANDKSLQLLLGRLGPVRP